MDQHEHKKIVSAALGKFKFNQQREVNPFILLIERAKRTTMNVLYQVRPILQAGGGFDKPALSETLTKFYLEEFRNYSKEELENLITMMHVEEAMGIIERDPHGKGTPDLMSGENTDIKIS